MKILSEQSIGILTLLLTVSGLQAQPGLMNNTYTRDAKYLDGKWHYIIDPYENGYYNYRYQPWDQVDNPGKSAYFMDAVQESKSELLEYNFDTSPLMNVPGDWNSQEEMLLYYEGTVWFRQRFDYSPGPNARQFLCFGAVNYQADVYLNGKKLGTHIGGFTPFQYEVTGQLKEKGNSLVVKVDNKRRADGVPTLNTDWWNYGGITRSVKIIETPSTYISDYTLQLGKDEPGRLKGYVQLEGSKSASAPVTLDIGGLGISESLVTDASGRALVDLKLKKPRYWSPEDPFLYDVSLKAGDDRVEERIGLRTVSTEGKKILLNGGEVFLRGICIHEESPFRQGRGHSEEDARTLLQWAKDLGCNYVRLAHYPHNEHMPRLADEMGIMVWEENPVYWTIQWENPETFANAEKQLEEVIFRDKNRASVIIWSMANETPTSQPRFDFLNRLATRARELDPTRLISAALEQSNYQGDPKTRTIDDPFANVVDVLSFNQYVGWYDGMPGKCGEITWHIEQDKPVLISEFGAGAKYGVHGDSTARWTEEYQAWLYRETVAMLEKVEHVQGFTPWILVDFRSPRRPLPLIQDGWNRKGLISEDGKRKEAFYVLQEYYQKKAAE